MILANSTEIYKINEKEKSAEFITTSEHGEISDILMDFKGKIIFTSNNKIMYSERGQTRKITDFTSCKNLNLIKNILINF